jgi:hypothetical protein
MEDPASDRLRPAPDPLSPLRGKFPGWEAWVGVGGILYVRRRMTSPPVVFRAETAGDLATQMHEHELKRRFSSWAIERVDGPGWSGYCARRGEAASPDEETITAATIADLELRLTGWAQQ